MSSTHSDRLERWLGAEKVAELSASMRGWYGPPIAVGNTPGSVWATGDGDFIGSIKAGQFCSGAEWYLNRLKRALKRQLSTCNAGFSGVADLLSEIAQGKNETIILHKLGVAAATGAVMTSWGYSGSPPQGGAAAAAPGGETPAVSTTGAYIVPSVSTDTRHIIGWRALESAGRTLLLYDRLFQVDKTMNSSTNESVTGAPTRYQSSTVSDPDYAGGNFLFIEVGGTALASTAHDWGVAGSSNEVLYRNQAGTDNSVLPVVTGNAAAIAYRLDMPLMQWFCPLASGDVGVMDLAQMRCSASVATGVISFVIGHPLSWLPFPSSFMSMELGLVNTAFGMTRIFDGACLAFLEFASNANASNVFIDLDTVSG